MVKAVWSCLRLGRKRWNGEIGSPAEESVQGGSGPAEGVGKVDGPVDEPFFMNKGAHTLSRPVSSGGATINCPLRFLWDMMLCRQLLVVLKWHG